MVFLTCPDGRPAPIPAGGCCPSISACFENGKFLVSSNIGSSNMPLLLTAVGRRSNPLGSLLSNGNLLQTLSGATHGTNLGTVLSIVNLLNNVQQLTNDVCSYVSRQEFDTISSLRDRLDSSNSAVD